MDLQAVIVTLEAIVATLVPVLGKDACDGFFATNRTAVILTFVYPLCSLHRDGVLYICDIVNSKSVRHA